MVFLYVYELNPIPKLHKSSLDSSQVYVNSFLNTPECVSLPSSSKYRMLPGFSAPGARIPLWFRQMLPFELCRPVCKNNDTLTRRSWKKRARSCFRWWRSPSVKLPYVCIITRDSAQYFRARLLDYWTYRKGISNCAIDKCKHRRRFLHYRFQRIQVVECYLEQLIRGVARHHLVFEPHRHQIVELTQPTQLMANLREMANSLSPCWIRSVS